MNEIISFENAKQRVMLKKSTYVGKFSIIANRNNFSEGEYKINSEDILNKEFDFFVYSIRKNGEKVVNCFPKVDDIILATLLTRILQNYEI